MQFASSVAFFLDFFIFSKYFRGNLDKKDVFLMEVKETKGKEDINVNQKPPPFDFRRREN